MSAWGKVPAAPPQAASLSAIMATEAAVSATEAADASDGELQAALAASRVDAAAEEDALAAALLASALDAEAARTSTTGDDASLALALSLADEEAAAGARASAAVTRASRHQRDRNEKVRVRLAGDDSELLESACRAAPNERGDDDDDDDVVGSTLRAEGVVIEATGAAGIIGRRADGSLVSKHDARLDAGIKARTLECRLDASGDMRGARVPARAYHGLVAFQRRVTAQRRR